MNKEINQSINQWNDHIKSKLHVKKSKSKVTETPPTDPKVVPVKKQSRIKLTAIERVRNRISMYYSNVLLEETMDIMLRTLAPGLMPIDEIFIDNDYREKAAANYIKQSMTHFSASLYAARDFLLNFIEKFSPSQQKELLKDCLFRSAAYHFPVNVSANFAFKYCTNLNYALDLLDPGSESFLQDIILSDFRNTVLSDVKQGNDVKSAICKRASRRNSLPSEIFFHNYYNHPNDTNYKSRDFLAFVGQIIDQDILKTPSKSIPNIVKSHQVLRSTSDESKNTYDLEYDENYDETLYDSNCESVPDY